MFIRRVVFLIATAAFLQLGTSTMASDKDGNFRQTNAPVSAQEQDILETVAKHPLGVQAIFIGVRDTANAKENMTASSNNEHHRWLLDRIKEAKTIETGISRAALLKLFEVEAGLQQTLPTRYTLKNCPEIHIEVTFDSAGKQTTTKRPVASDEDLVILTVSPLYLDYVAGD